MAWKMVRSEPTFKEEQYFGKCPRFDKDAIIIGYYHGNKWTKTDLQLTYQLEGYNCNMLTNTHEDGFCPYVESGKCYFVPPKYL